MKAQAALRGLALALVAISGGALAQEEDGNDSILEEVVVTGVARGTVKLETSVSVSSLDYSEANKYSARSLGEIYRSLPGLRSEPATGEGNGSIAVRGIPLATGGYKYVQLQEDGLPVLQFGDIIVGNVPNYVRGDFTLSRIEAIRGGSASTLTSDAPGGIINHISKTGEEEGGAIGLGFGLDFDELRFDFNYGGPLSDDMYFHVGGYWREGEGVREVGYDANTGGQIRGNITKELDNGYLRFHYKKIDENLATYHNFVSVANDGGGFSPFGGWDGSSESAGTIYRTSKNVINADGSPGTRRPADQITVNLDAFGIEGEFDLDGGFTVSNRFRTSRISGGQISALPFGAGDLGNATDLGAAICNCTNPIVTLGAGPNAGDVYTGLALQYLELDFLNDALDFVVNDLRVTYEASDTTTITGGLYYSSQDIVQNWPNWDRYITEFNGDNAVPLVITDGDTDIQYSDPNGTFARGLLSRLVDLNYKTLAPYVDVNFILDDLSINASLRQDEVKVRGVAAGSVAGFAGVATPCDTNGDGDTTDPLDECAISDLNNGTVHNYDPSYTSFSLGANYAFGDNQAVFARISEGGVVVADRLFDGGADRVLAANAGLSDGVDDVMQFEIGYKLNANDFDLFATFFRAETEETQSEVTTGNVFVQEYEATGLELEAVYNIGDFDINANLTWTDAEIVSSDTAPQNVGNRPNRQADYIYTISPTYSTDNFTGGITLVGSGDFFIGDNETVKQDAYMLVHAFASYYLNDNFSVSVNGNNLTDEYVASFGEGGIVTFQGQSLYGAEVLNGRSISASIKYEF